MKKMIDQLGFGSVLVLGVTLILFVLALFLKGFSKELLIEAGVFLVSVKIIMSSYRNNQDTKIMIERLKTIESLLRLSLPAGKQDSVHD